MSSIKFVKKGDTYSFDCGDGITVEVDRLKEESGGLHGELTVYSHKVIAGGLLHNSRLNLAAAQTRAGIVRSLAKRDKEIGEETWQQILEYVCFLTQEDFRKGQPVIDLVCVGDRPAARWLLKPFIEADAATVMFGSGGSAKSTLALAMAISVATGKALVGQMVGQPAGVLYLDWESDEFEHKERFDAMCLAANITPPENKLLYQRMGTSLAEAAATAKRTVVDKGVGLVVVDSFGLAKGCEPEGADASLRAFAALRSFGVAALLVDHVSQAVASGTAGVDKPYGSVYTVNSARVVWKVEKAQNVGDSKLVVQLSNTKINHGPLFARKVYELNYLGDEDTVLLIHIEPSDVAKVPALVAKLSLPQRVLLELRNGAKTNRELAENLGVELERIEPITSRHAKNHKVVAFRGVEGLLRYGLPNTS